MLEKRKYPIGAEVLSKGVDFRVYAPLCKKVEVALELSSNQSEFFPLKFENTGYFSGSFPQFTNNSRYRFRLDDSEQLYPNPASRFQPDGPFGPSQVINGQDYAWKDQDWKGVHIEGQILYEMHIGTFTQEGTFSAAQKELQELANLGVTVLEIMPLNDFPGRFGWGYDGVNLFAPTRLYGTPDDVKNFINEAHRLNIAVISGCRLQSFWP